MSSNENRSAKRFMGVRVFVLSAFLLFAAGVCGASIVTTKHNLSWTGPGTIKAVSEKEICVFCHTPHGASTELPLWNHQLSTQVYTLPDTANGWPNLLTTVQPPDKGSRLCLSCHDGTVAIGLLVNMPGPGSGGKVSMVTGDFLIPTDYGYIGTDLSGSHPVSIAVNDQLISDKNNCAGKPSGSYLLQYPPPGDPVKLKPTGNTYAGQPGRAAVSPNGLFAYSEGVQCASCHDPHLAGVVDFLVKGTGTADPVKGHPGSVSALCSSCHQGTCP